MLAIQKNTLYMSVLLPHSSREPTEIDTTHRYGGIFESARREYTLDDFYSINLDKMDKFVCLKKSEIVIAKDDDESSSEDEDDSDDIRRQMVGIENFIVSSVN